MFVRKVRIYSVHTQSLKVPLQASNVHESHIQVPPNMFICTNIFNISSNFHNCILLYTDISCSMLCYTMTYSNYWEL